MLDHVLGRPSVKSRRLQVLAVLAFWSAYMYRGHKHGPAFVRFLSRFWSKRLTAWQTVVLTMIYLYAARNFSTLFGLASPEPMSNMYEKAYFRATWVLTALDAGFWTAMRIRSKWLRDIASVVFSLFYMVAAERADEKVRKVRGMLTVEHLRVSWNKGTTPYISFFQGLMRPRLTRERTRGAGRGKGKEVAYEDSRDAEAGVEPIDEERDGETNGRVRQRQGVRPRSGTTGKSLNKLKSSDDLLGRRMQGLAGGLTGLGEED
ncbi:hypothetical protein BN1723_015290, partial [Verticillium longisporum]